MWEKDAEHWSTILHVNTVNIVHVQRHHSHTVIYHCVLQCAACPEL